MGRQLGHISGTVHAEYSNQIGPQLDDLSYIPATYTITIRTGLSNAVTYVPETPGGSAEPKGVEKVSSGNTEVRVHSVY